MDLRYWVDGEAVAVEPRAFFDAVWVVVEEYIIHILVKFSRIDSAESGSVCCI